MRRYIIIALALVTGIALTSCDEYDYKSPEQTLFVVEADLDFPSDASEGKIVVEAPGTVTATSSETWCEVSVSGKTINVKASANPDFTNRTALVVIKYGEETQQVPVTQASTLFVLENSSLTVRWQKSESTMEVLKYSLPLSVESNDPWIIPSVEGGTVTVITEENPYGNPRTGSFIIKSGALEQTVTVTQELQPISYSALLGTWDWTCTNATTGDPVSATLTFTEKVAGKSYTVTGFPVFPTHEVTMIFDDVTGNITAAAGQQTGTSGSYKVKLVALNASYGNVSWSESILYKGVWNLDINNPKYEFVDTGTWSGQTIAGLCFAQFTAADAYGGNYVNYVYWNMAKQ